MYSDSSEIQTANLKLTYYKPPLIYATQITACKMQFERIWMIQPATLRLESNVEQQNTTYLNVEALQMVSMLQLQMLVSKLVILTLGVYKQHW